MCRNVSVLTKHNLLHQSDEQQKSHIADWRLLDASVMLQPLTCLIAQGWQKSMSPRRGVSNAGSLSV